MNGWLGWLVTVSVLLGGSISSSAQVAVYRMDLEREPHSINFSFFDGGYFVLDGLNLSGSFIFTYQDQNRDTYLTAENAAEMFVAIKKDVRRAVIRATAQTPTSLSHYLAIGELDESITFRQRGQKVSFELASLLKGHVLASDDESDISVPAEDETVGFAGLASIALHLEVDRTHELNRLSLTLEEAVVALTEELERQGFHSGTETDEEGVAETGATPSTAP